MVKNLMLASVLAASFGAQAAMHIKLELNAPNTETQTYEIDIELTDRATLTLGDTDLHISVIPAQDSEEGAEKIVIVIETDVRNEQNEIINQGTAHAQTIWGAPAVFTLVNDQENVAGPVTLSVTASQN